MAKGDLLLCFLYIYLLFTGVYIRMEQRGDGMLFKEIEPFVRQALMVDMLPHYTFRPLKTRDARLFYILSGSGKILIERTAYDIAPGMVVVFQAGTEYEWHTQDMRYMTINFDYTARHKGIRRTFSPVVADRFPEDNFSERLTFDDAPEMNEPLVGYDLTLLEESIRALVIEYHLKGAWCDELLCASLKAILVRLLRARRAESKVSNKQGARTVGEIIEYIQMNAGKDINNRDIARAFHFSEAYVGRLFKSYVGVSLHAFLLDWRIAMAKQYLSDGLPVSRAAELCGFTDSCHFSKMFKKKTGETPLQYGKKHYAGN